jgi:hypothetical protein
MRTHTTLTIVCMLFIASSGYAQDNYPKTTTKTKSPIGILEYKGGFPTQPTIDKAFDQLDRQRATQAYLEDRCKRILSTNLGQRSTSRRHWR